MTELGTALDAYLTLADCHTVTAELLRKSSKGLTFHGTVFMGQPPDETKRLLTQAKTELDDWAIVGLVSTFERILFKHDRSPLRSKPLREGVEGLHDAIKPFKKLVSRRTYEDVDRLGHYRDWVAHGKRWGEKPAQSIKWGRVLQSNICPSTLVIVPLSSHRVLCLHVKRHS